MGREYVAGFRRLYTDLAKRNDVAFVPFLLKGVGGVDTLNQPDMIHPNARGAAVVAETIWSALRPLLGASDSTHA
jgi:acyl-CoA thioesterase I